MLSADKPKKLFLLDAYALIYRAYFAFSKNPRVNSKGQNTSAAFGFTNVLIDVIKNEKPTHLAVVFDPPGGSAHRQEEFAGDRALRIAGMLCRDPKFWEFLYSRSDISTKDYESATHWLRFYLELESRSQIKTNAVAQAQLDKLYREYTLWQGKT
jgi:hypothetical protein